MEDEPTPIRSDVVAPGRKPRSTKEQVMARRRRVFEQRIQGMSIQKIADKEGLSYWQIHQDLEAAARLVDVTKYLEHELHLDLQRLDQLFYAWFPAAIAGDADAARIALTIMDRRAKLLGLDAPKRVDVTAMIAVWAEKEGLELQDVLDVVGTLLPSPEVN